MREGQQLVSRGPANKQDLYAWLPAVIGSSVPYMPAASAADPLLCIPVIARAPQASNALDPVGPPPLPSPAVSLPVPAVQDAGVPDLPAAARSSQALQGGCVAHGPHLK